MLVEIASSLLPHYTVGMASSDTSLEQKMLVRMTTEEKKVFEKAAKAKGFVSLSAWVRDRLREIAVRDLDSVGEPDPFRRDTKRKSS